MGSKEIINAPRLRYIDAEDRAWLERMQDPETWDQIRLQFLEKELEDWPDQIFLADMPQVPDIETDSPIVEIVGRCEGSINNRKDVTIVPTDIEVEFLRPKSTKFVRVVREGMELMERWDIDKHGEWEKIPNIGLTPPQLIERLYGFGDTAIEQGQQFNQTRKRNASKTNWKVNNYPSFRVSGLWKK